MNYAPITISRVNNNGKFDSLLNLEGLSFIGLTSSSPPRGSSNTSSSIFPSTTVAILITLTKTYINSTSMSRVSNTIIANSSGSNTLSIYRDRAIPYSTLGFFYINETTFSKCAFGYTIPI